MFSLVKPMRGIAHQQKQKKEITKFSLIIYTVSFENVIEIKESQQKLQRLQCRKGGNFMSFYFHLIMNKCILMHFNLHCSNELSVKKGNSSFCWILANNHKKVEICNLFNKYLCFNILRKSIFIEKNIALVKIIIISL